MWCENCGVSGEKARLFDVVSAKEKGVVKLCEACAKAEGLPILRRPTTLQLKEAEKKTSYYQRVDENRKNMQSDYPQRQQNIMLKEIRHGDVELRKIIDRNYEKQLPTERKPRPDLIDNFHWVIMRFRRLKKITQEQLAKELSESEAAIKMAEKGILPEDDYRLIRKLESFLGVRLVKDEALIRKKEQAPEKNPARIIKFDPEAMENLKIADLQRMQAMKEDIDIGFIPEPESEGENFKSNGIDEDKNG